MNKGEIDMGSSDSEMKEVGDRYLSHQQSQQEMEGTTGRDENGQSEMMAMGANRDEKRRIREKTEYKGVTKTYGKMDGAPKYDVQFVFCDGGSKKHPKIYGFENVTDAARSFDILILKRAYEKIEGGFVDIVKEEKVKDTTNFPIGEYGNEELLKLIAEASRDDVIYALKAAAKRSFPLEPGVLVENMKICIQFCELESSLPATGSHAGEKRLSYEKTKGDKSGRKRSSKKKKENKEKEEENQNLGYGGQINNIMQILTGNIQGQGMSNLPMPNIRKDESGSQIFNGFTFLLELCQLLSTIYSEMGIAADLLRLWKALKSSVLPETKLETLSAQANLLNPLQFYVGFIPVLQECETLDDIMTFLLSLWASRGWPQIPVQATAQLNPLMSMWNQVGIPNVMEEYQHVSRSIGLSSPPGNGQFVANPEVLSHVDMMSLVHNTMAHMTNTDTDDMTLPKGDMPDKA